MIFYLKYYLLKNKKQDSNENIDNLNLQTSINKINQYSKILPNNIDKWNGNKGVDYKFEVFHYISPGKFCFMI